MMNQKTGFVFRFNKVIPGIIASIIAQENPSIQTAHEYFEKYDRRRMINGKWKDFPPNDQMQQNSSSKQVKEKQKVSQHRKFT
jgi:hypothetical protein